MGTEARGKAGPGGEVRRQVPNLLKAGWFNIQSGALVGLVQSLGSRLARQMVAGEIPAQGTCGMPRRRPAGASQAVAPSHIDVSLLLAHLLSLKSNANIFNITKMGRP